MIGVMSVMTLKQQNKLRGLSPLANYTDRAIAEANAKFCGWTVLRCQHDGSQWAYSRFSRPAVMPLYLFFLSFLFVKGLVKESGSNCMLMGIIIYSLHHLLLG
jgi:hypothetical protein